MSARPVPPGGEGPAGPEADATVTNLDSALRLAPGSRVAQRYRIDKLLGLGAMGLVYQAHDEELGLDVALKVLRPEYARDPDLIERFRRELVLARQVSHENVVRIHDLGKDGDLLFLTMDLVEGRSLREVLEAEGRLPVDTAVGICRQLARALAAAHDKGIVHRDLKPSNVMIDESGRALITDFGVARSIHAAGLTGTGIVVGTPDYLAPEQYRGDELDGRCDLYALGVVLYEMLVGARPFSSGTAAESMAQRMSGLPVKVPPLRDTPANLRHIIRRCLEPDRQRRYASGHDLDSDLAALSRPKRQFPRRRSLLFAAALLAAIIALGTLAWRAIESAPEEAGAGDVQPLQTLAVLPFVDETGQSELGWLGRGIPELLFGSLVASGSIQMVDPERVSNALADLKLDPASMSSANLAQAMELFDADRLLTGSVRTDGTSLRIDARLISADAGAAAVPLNVEAPLADGTPSRVVNRLETAVLAEMAVRGAPAAEASSLDSPALPAYTEALVKLRQGDSLAARELLEKATTADSEFGAAWLRLAQAYEALGFDSEALEAADRASAVLGEGTDRLAIASRAEQARLAGDPERSLKLLGELVKRYPTDLEAKVELADAYGAAGRFDEALEDLAEVVERSPSHPQAWYLRAKYSILSGASRLAVDDYLVRAMVIQNKLRNRQGQADVLNAFGVAYRQLGELEQAEQSYQRAAELRQELGDERGYATTLRNLAQIAIARGRFEEAESNLIAARDRLESLGDEGGIADLYNELGMMEEARGRYEESLAQFRLALQIRRRQGDQRAIGESLNNIGFASHELGRVDDASVYWGQALDIFNATGNRQGQVSVMQSLGQLQTTQGEWAAANQSYLQALELARSLDWTPAVAASLGFLGRVAHYQGRYEPALSYYGEALERFEAIEDGRGVVEFGLARISELLDLGSLDLAGESLDGLDQLLSDLGSADQKAEGFRLRARLAISRGDAGTARGALEQAAAAVGEGGSRAVALRLALAVGASKSDLTALEEAVGEAEAMGDVALTLEAGEDLLRAQLDAERYAQAQTLFSKIERTLRRVGDYSRSHRLYRLRARLAAAIGEPPEPWNEKARSELDRISEGLSPQQVAYLTEAQDAG
jgi:tetratricopeptide (TPR) repeat protein/TolB-like protein